MKTKPKLKSPKQKVKSAVTKPKMKCGEGKPKMQQGGTGSSLKDNRVPISRKQIEKNLANPNFNKTTQAKQLRDAMNEKDNVSSDTLWVPKSGVTGPIFGNNNPQLNTPKKKITYKATPYKFKKGGSKKKC
jgi:hypothetical protein